MAFVANPGRVLATATSLWAAYGGLAILLLDKGQEWLKGPGTDKLISPEWRDILLGLCLILIPPLRIWQQRALATAAERELEEERLTRLRLEQVATSEGPPISPEDVKAIKREAAAATRE